MAKLCPVIEADIGLHPNNILLVAFVCQAYIGVTHAVGVDDPDTGDRVHIDPSAHFPYLVIH